MFSSKSADTQLIETGFIVVVCDNFLHLFADDSREEPSLFDKTQRADSHCCVFQHPVVAPNESLKSRFVERIEKIYILNFTKHWPICRKLVKSGPSAFWPPAFIHDYNNNLYLFFFNQRHFLVIPFLFCYVCL